MGLFKISFKSSSTFVDSIKISRAIIYAYNILYPDNIGDLIDRVKTSSISFSDLLPYNNKVYYHFPYINNIGPIGENRKNMPKFIDFEKLREIIAEYQKNGYTGIKYSGINPDNDIKPHVLPISEPGINIFKSPIEEDNNYKYNDIFTKELFFYRKSCFYIRNSDKKIQAAINLLNDFGISGRRNTGKGQVSIEQINDDFNEGFKGEGLYILLSSFIPHETSIKNIDFERSRYNIKIFQGKNINGKPIGPFRYFIPGTIFYLTDDIKGMSYIEDNSVMPFNPVIMKVL